MPANLPQQHIPGRHTASPSFSPQQLQRGVEVVPGGGGPHPPQPQPSNLGPEGMMTSPMVNQQMPMQQSMMTAAHRAQQQSAIVNAAMNSVGLGGRDQSSLTHEEKVGVPRVGGGGGEINCDTDSFSGLYRSSCKIR